MKKSEYVAVILLFAVLIAVSSATVFVGVFESDGITPFDNRDIMVGTALTIVVSSDSTDYWGGGLYIAGQNRAMASLSARGYDPNALDWTGSHYAQAGDYARVNTWKGTGKWGFDLYSSDSNSVPGNWFVLDYEAIGAGEPNLWICDHASSFSEPNLAISFRHVPSRDFNEDDSVDMVDYALLSSYWLTTDCNEPDWCGGTDMNQDTYVDLDDLALFSGYWLGQPRSDYIPPVEDPNITFSIVDANGLNEIYLDVGESITLYVDMATRGVNINVFQLDVHISDPNLGSIDNTPIDPNDPPGEGTARILASPRATFFDDWGPGIEQSEGIYFIGANLFGSISDGHLASFVFTCQGEGDVTLTLLNMRDYSAILEDMTIHQVDPNSQMMSAPMGMMQESSLSATPQEMTLDVMISMLEEIWLSDENVQETISEDDWQKFMDELKNSYETEVLK
jgi:hypothetical protein